MAYTEDHEGNVILTLESKDYESLLLCLGMATGYAVKEGNQKIANSFLELANRINLGNPDWTPYKTSAQAYD